MCARVFISATARQLTGHFRVPTSDNEAGALASMLPRYNGAPSLDYFAVTAAGSGRAAAFLRWGYPVRAAGGRPQINARGETVATSGPYRASWHARRALLPVDGFFEWDAGKLPFAVALADRQPMALGIVWDRSSGGEPGFAVITVAANDVVAPIHDRMPLILPEEDHDRWLAGPDPRDLIRPFSGPLVAWRVRKEVGNPRFGDARAIEPLPAEDAPPQGRLL